MAERAKDLLWSDEHAEYVTDTIEFLFSSAGLGDNARLSLVKRLVKELFEEQRAALVLHEVQRIDFEECNGIVDKIRETLDACTRDPIGS